MDEKWKVYCVMSVMRMLPQERSEAREVLKLANELVEFHGHDTPMALRPKPKAATARKKRNASRPPGATKRKAA
jgi:hypothetical protein